MVRGWRAGHIAGLQLAHLSIISRLQGCSHCVHSVGLSQPGGLNNRTVLSHGPGGQEPEIKVSAKLFPAEGMRGDLSQALSQPSRPLVIYGFPWLTGTASFPLPCSHCILPMCVCLRPNLPFP